MKRIKCLGKRTVIILNVILYFLFSIQKKNLSDEKHWNIFSFHFHIYIYIYIYIYILHYLCPTCLWISYIKCKKVNLLTIVEGHPKAPFSIATTSRCMGRALLLSLDCSTLPLICTLCWVLSKFASSNIFWVFGMTRPGIRTPVYQAICNYEKNESEIEVLYVIGFSLYL